MTFDEWRDLLGKKVIDGSGDAYKVIGLVTDPAAILQNELGQRSTS